ncbi:MAG TPA: archaetidylserine decarboxylase [Xanthobacteraceae bacterium]|nr:archaetidylserine decarboxylase [Xanthobacteraceae bacterium]
MTVKSRILRALDREDVNFVLTNRLPRRVLNRFAGWFSRIEQPLVRDLSIAVWRFFSDLDLSEARDSQFRSMHDCFTRRLKPGARPIDQDPNILVSPCDAIVGAHGAIRGTTLYQIKGAHYELPELLCDDALAETYRNGRYVTLRLTSSMYHRFHAPYDCRVEHVAYIPGDTWNVNPAALRRVDKLYCKNERAVLRTRLTATGDVVSLVPVGAILVAGIRLHFVDVERCLKPAGSNGVRCAAEFRKGDEMGWFEHGSTIVVFAPARFALCDNIKDGAKIRLGEPLMRLR